jgi:polysaccharide deacetylase 2 family uncharacterized protein YibQ
MNAAMPPGPQATPPKPPVPTTNLLPAIIVVAVVACLCLALAVLLPAPRRPATTPPPASVPVQTLPPAAPLPPLPAVDITEYEDTTKATLPTPTTVETSPTTTTSPTEPLTPKPDTLPRWQSNAQPAPAIPQGHAKLAIVIDDMGVDEPLTRQAMAQLPTTVTFAFLPYGRNTRQLAATAHSNGHEILIHMPMEPLPRTNGDAAPTPGPRALLVEDDAATRAENLARNLAALSNLAVGANNHMGSRFTQWEEGMRDVLATLNAEGLLFLDSVTTAHTATRKAAKDISLTIPLLRRDVFLDDSPTVEAVENELAHAIAVARKNGQAIAIGHPHPATLAVLGQYLSTLEQAGVTLVPLTALIQK